MSKARLISFLVFAILIVMAVLPAIAAAGLFPEGPHDGNVI